jgi:NADH dehydrogenase FAD-containing subunit
MRVLSLHTRRLSNKVVDWLANQAIRIKLDLKIIKVNGEIKEVKEWENHFQPTLSSHVN